MMRRDEWQGGRLALWGVYRDPVPFLEAHPRLKAAEVAGALLSGADTCIWRWPDGAPFARATVKIVQDGMLLVEGEYGRVLDDNASVLVRVHQASNYSDKRRFSLFSCPRCSRSCQHLVLTYRWHCDRCSGLKYRSQSVGSKVAAWERLQKLKDEVGTGRPKGMHNATYARKRQELKELRRKLRGPEAVAPIEYLHTLVGRWARRPEPARDAAPHADEEQPFSPRPRTGPSLLEKDSDDFTWL